jgi:hypothetical protein
MNKQVLRILELILQLKRDKGYEISFSYFGHVNSIQVRYDEGFKYQSRGDDYAYQAIVYLDQPRAEGGVNSIIKHLEKL